MISGASAMYSRVAGSNAEESKEGTGTQPVMASAKERSNRGAERRYIPLSEVRGKDGELLSSRLPNRQVTFANDAAGVVRGQQRGYAFSNQLYVRTDEALSDDEGESKSQYGTHTGRSQKPPIASSADRTRFHFVGEESVSSVADGNEQLEAEPKTSIWRRGSDLVSSAAGAVTGFSVTGLFRRDRGVENASSAAVESKGDSEISEMPSATAQKTSTLEVVDDENNDMIPRYQAWGIKAKMSCDAAYDAVAEGVTQFAENRGLQSLRPTRLTSSFQACKDELNTMKATLRGCNLDDVGVVNATIDTVQKQLNGLESKYYTEMNDCDKTWFSLQITPEIDAVKKQLFLLRQYSQSCEDRGIALAGFFDAIKKSQEKYGDVTEEKTALEAKKQQILESRNARAAQKLHAEINPNEMTTRFGLAVNAVRSRLPTYFSGAQPSAIEALEEEAAQEESFTQQEQFDLAINISFTRIAVIREELSNLRDKTGDCKKLMQAMLEGSYSLRIDGIKEGLEDTFSNSPSEANWNPVTLAQAELSRRAVRADLMDRLEGLNTLERAVSNFMHVHNEHLTQKMFCGEGVEKLSAIASPLIVAGAEEAGNIVTI